MGVRESGGMKVENVSKRERITFQLGDAKRERVTFFQGREKPRENANCKTRPRTSTRKKPEKIMYFLVKSQHSVPLEWNHMDNLLCLFQQQRAECYVFFSFQKCYISPSIGMCMENVLETVGIKSFGEFTRCHVLDHWTNHL